MKLKRLSPKEYDLLAGYIYISVQKGINEEQMIAPKSDYFFTKLGRCSAPLFLEDEKNRPYFQLLHLGGGIMQNESFQTDISVGDDSQTIITSQSATKIYKCEKDNEKALYKVNVEVGKNSMLEFYNDSIILHEDAKYFQENIINLQKSSNFIFNEIFSSGYSEKDDNHPYDLMHLKTELYVDSELEVFDNLILEPKKEDPNEFGVLNGFKRCGTGFYFSEKITTQHIEELKKEVNSFIKNTDTRVGISAFEASGFGLRILSNETYEVEDVFKLINNYVRKNVFSLNELLLRKQ